MTPAALLFIQSFSIPLFSHPPLPMASEFSYLTSPESDDSAAVDAIVSQAIDSSILENIAELNSSHLSCSSSLPDNLDTRFQKLKSFPIANNSQPRTRKNATKIMRSEPIHESTTTEFHTPSRAEAEITSSLNPNGEKSSAQELRDGFSSSSSLSSIRPSRESPSPPRRACCFGCSSKRAPTKKTKDNRDWGKNDEILTDFSTFSFKQQQKNLKKALKEEEKASREAAKVVEWVKQASARMDVSAIDELLSEDEKYCK